jgi:aspartate carbamoyltransferase catalytic subunit
LNNPPRHLLQIEGLLPPQIGAMLDLAESYVLLNRSGKTQRVPAPVSN